MGATVTVVVAALAGAVLGTTAVLGVVQVRTATPAPVAEPLVVYGSR